MPNEQDLEFFRRHMQETMSTDEQKAELKKEQIKEQELFARLTELARQDKEKRKPILCLDFDGVIHSYTSGWKGADVIPDPPVKGAFAFIRRALHHFEVHVYSTRSNHPGGIVAMEEWFVKHGWPGTFLTGAEGIIFDTQKPPALVTLDDRAITFTGEWPDMDTLKNFKPWNKSE